MLCGINIIKTNFDLLSPNFPNHYPNNHECSSIIRFKKEQRIFLQLNEFDLEGVEEYDW